jgi:serine/threonine protein kinase
MINQQIQNYRIISLLGQGGMGDVYLAEHISIKRKVAIKVLKPELVKNEEIRKRFKNEASMLAHLQHPNIVGLVDYVEQEDGLFLIMEYVDGQGLDELIKAQHSPLDIELAKKLMSQILQAFLYAHKNGIVHRDVKPSNILVTADDQIKVLDFGIAKLVGDNQHHLTKTGTQIGTIYYMSPEQVKGKELDYRSDIYSLGVTFYELLSGVCPYRGLTTEYEIYDNIVKEPLLPLTQTMGDAYITVWSVIEKATQKEINRRFQDCDEFQTALATSKNRASNENKVNSSQKEIPQKKIETQPNKYSNLKKVSVSLGVLLFIGYFLLNGNQPTTGKTGVIKTDKETIVKSLPTNYEDPDKIEQPKIEQPKIDKPVAKGPEKPKAKDEDPKIQKPKEEEKPKVEATNSAIMKQHKVAKNQNLKDVLAIYKAFSPNLTLEKIKSANSNLNKDVKNQIESETEFINVGTKLFIPCD